MLSVSLFGTPSLTLEGAPLTIPRRKSRALLFYLAAHDHPLTRDHLLALFWTDLDRPAAQQTLRTTLHGLRKLLGPHLVAEDDTVSLAPDTRVDSRLFESALRRAEPDLQALALYQGDFLSGLSLPDTPSFDDWAAAERERFRRLAVRGLTALSRQREAAEDYAAGLDALDSALALDPLQEDLQRAAMRLHYLAGDRAGAIRRYDSLRRLLDSEMGVPPMAETRTLYDSILNDTLTPGRGRGPGPGAPLTRAAPPPTLEPQLLPFVGREAELAALHAARALGRVALIEGEPGIGKTRLAEEFMRAAGAIDLVGRAHELEQLLPYRPVIEALRSLLARADWPALHAALRDTLSPVWLAEVARLVPELDAGGPGPADGPPPHADESRLWEGLHQFLVALSGQHPVVVFVDDLQWADSSTLALLGYLVRQPDRSGSIFYAAAARPPAPRSPTTLLLQTLTRQDRLTRLPLRRLAPHDMLVAARALCANSAEALVDWLVSSSEGNPYVLVELLRHARASSLVGADGQVDLAALSKSPIVPQTIYSLAQSRLGRLSDPARRVLDAAVAAGREFDFDIVYRAAGISESAALDALDELRAEGLVHPLDWNAESPSGRALYAFDHNVTMEVAYREVGEARHRLMHRRIAEAMDAAHHTHLDQAAGLIASHFIEGGDPERAAAYAFRAGRSAESLAAWAEAIRFYEQALPGETDDRRRFEVLTALAGARMQAGEAPQASEALLEALALARALADPARVQAAQIDLGESMLAQARFSEAIEWAQQLLDAPPENSAIAASAEALWGTTLSLEGADLGGAAEHLQRAAALLRDESQPANPARLSQITFELGSVAAQQGDLKRAVGLYRDALAMVENVEAGPGLQPRILAHNNLAYHLHLLGPSGPGEAVDHAQAGLRLAQENGVLGLQPFLFSTLGEIALAAGDLEAAEQRFGDGLAIAERLSIPERIAGLTANLGLVALARGQTDLAIHRLSTALARADSLGTRHLAAQIRLWLAPLLPAGEARAYLAEVRAMAESSGRSRLLREVEALEHTLSPEDGTASSV